MRPIILAALLALAPLPARAAQPEAAPAPAAVLADCLSANTTTLIEGQLKEMIVGALTEDKAKFDSAGLAFGTSIVSLAIEKCGLTLSELEGPVFAQAVEISAGRLGEKVMTEAMAKLGG